MDDLRAALLDTLACALHARSAKDVQGLTRACAGGGSVPIWWSTAAGDAVGAAFANAYSTHRLDFDSFHPATLGHPAAVVLPAALAAWSDLDSPGAAVIEGYVAGIEMMAALAAAFGADIRRRGAHPTVVIGKYGAAAAAGAVLGLTAAGMDAAFDLCAALAPQGPVSTFGTLGKPLQVANACQVGLRAASLAAAGVGRVGTPWWHDLMLSAGRDPAAGHIWKLPTAHGLLERAPTCFKEVPLCGFLIPTISGLVGTGLTISPADRVASIELTVPPSVMDAGRRPVPASIDEARFSLEFAVLSALTAPRRNEVYLSAEAFASAVEAFVAQGLLERLRIRAGAEEPAASIRITVEDGPAVDHRWTLSPLEPESAGSVGRRKLVREGEGAGVPTALLDRLFCLVEDFPTVVGSEFSRHLGQLGGALRR